MVVILMKVKTAMMLAAALVDGIDDGGVAGDNGCIGDGSDDDNSVDDDGGCFGGDWINSVSESVEDGSSVAGDDTLCK